MARSRQRKLEQFLSLINPAPELSILDVGVADAEYSPYDNFLEKHYPYPDRITALSIYPLEGFKKRYPAVNAVTYDGDRFPFDNKSFSVVHSNAVIEHVGGREGQSRFISEMCRVGHRFFFTTPAREFPLELHTNLPFFHWFPKPVFDRLARHTGKAWACGDYMNLLTKSALKELLDGSGVTTYTIYTHRLGPAPFNYAVWGGNFLNE